MNATLSPGDAIYYALEDADSRRELSLSSDVVAPGFSDGFRTTVSISSVRGRPGYDCDVKCESSWPEVVDAARHLAEWLEAQGFHHDVFCSGSSRAWIRFRIFSVSELVAIELMKKWAGVQIIDDRRDVCDLDQFEARLLNVTREFARVAEQLQACQLNRGPRKNNARNTAARGT